MYEEFYRLETSPFRTAPDPNFIYWAENHTLAFSTMRYAIMTRGPIAVVTGDIGAGKTTLVRQMLRETPADLEVALVSNLAAGRGKLMRWINASLSIDANGDDDVAMLMAFQEHLVERYAEGQRVTLVVDEAQNMSVAMLEELRMLSNINTDGDDLLQIILVGQPQLRDLLRRPELNQFAQRVTADFHLDPLSGEEVMRYIEHRLAVAGARWRIFSPDAARLVYKATGGVPRLVNLLCDLCMVYGYAADVRVVDSALVLEFLRGARVRGIYGQFHCVEDLPLNVVNS